MADLKEMMGYAADRADIRLLGDCLEIKNFDWQKAIEGYLGRRKFHVLVDPGAHKEALAAYKRLRRDKGYHSIGIIDGGRLLAEAAKPAAGSLAEEIIASDPVARAYVDYVLGRVMKSCHWI